MMSSFYNVQRADTFLGEAKQWEIVGTSIVTF